MKHLEIELKTLLKKDEYNRLKDQFTGVTLFFKQITTSTRLILNCEKRKSLCAFEPLKTGLS